MPKQNEWTIWLAGILVTLILFVALPTMATCIINNDVKYVHADEIIREDIKIGDEKTLDKVENKLSKLEEKIERLTQDQIALKVQTAQIFEAVQYIKKNIQ